MEDSVTLLAELFDIFRNDNITMETECITLKQDYPYERQDVYIVRFTISGDRELSVEAGFTREEALSRALKLAILTCKAVHDDTDLDAEEDVLDNDEEEDTDPLQDLFEYLKTARNDYNLLARTFDPTNNNFFSKSFYNEAIARLFDEYPSKINKY
jgi:hypothetical protein